MYIDVEEFLISEKIEFDKKGEKTAILSCASISSASKTDLSFCYYQDDKAVEYISNSDAGAILCNYSVKDKVNPKSNQQLIFVSNPRLIFVEILTKITKHDDCIYNISPNSYLATTAKVGENCSIGEFSIIGENCIIGNNCIIGKKVSISNCIMGNNCNIQSGATIGEDGFAYERNSVNSLIHFPHLGKVIIKDCVDIGANCSIARGSMSDTIIESGTKLDAMVHIAHNVHIGRDSELTAGAIVGGSTKIGKSTWLGLNSTLKDNVKVGDNVIVGAGAMVISDITDQDIVAGVPAKSIKHKVNTNMKFLMAGQNDDSKSN